MTAKKLCILSLAAALLFAGSIAYAALAYDDSDSETKNASTKEASATVQDETTTFYEENPYEVTPECEVEVSDFGVDADSFTVMIADALDSKDSRTYLEDSAAKEELYNTVMSIYESSEPAEIPLDNLYSDYCYAPVIKIETDSDKYTICVYSTSATQSNFYVSKKGSEGNRYHIPTETLERISELLGIKQPLEDYKQFVAD